MVVSNYQTDRPHEIKQKLIQNNEKKNKRKTKNPKVIIITNYELWLVGWYIAK